MQKYRLEFILRAKDTSTRAIKNSLAEFAEGLLEVVDTFAESKPHPSGCGKDTPLSINPETDPGLLDRESRRIDFPLEPQESGRDFKININTQEPTVIFDICSQFGRIKSVKIDEGEGRG